MSDQNTPLRMYVALRVLRAWNDGNAGWDGQVVHIVHEWVDGGMKGPIPWPDGNPFFDEWAAENGFSNVEGNIGFKGFAKLSGGEE